MESRVLGLVVALTLVQPAQSEAQSANPDLRTLSLQELMAIPVDTPGRVPQDRLRVSPSVFVITEVDILRSGATTIPEVLRMVPGMHVAQIDGNKWAIGIRGFTDRLARAMLVMIDGRAVYSPLFAGTYWEVQDLPLTDIERIEVVRGPGGALWGANAVTGTINIIRKTAIQSAGTAVTAGAGTADPWRVTAVYGCARPKFQYRISGKASARAAQATPGDLDYDDARILQGGARVDWAQGAGGFTLQGDIYRTVIGQRDNLVTYVPPANIVRITDDTLTGGNIVFRWQRRTSNPRSLRVQAYFDRSTRSELTFKEQQNVADLDVQQGLARGRHTLLFGAGYRAIDGHTETGGTLRFSPPNRSDQLYTAFAQDEVNLLRNRLTLTVGTKFEHNGYTGAEWQPGARLLWTLGESHAISLAVNRSVRTPSRVEHDFETGSLVNAQQPAFVRLQANPEFQSEELTAYEVGVISRPHSKLLLTAAGFHNEHDRVLSLELGTTFVELEGGGPRLVVPVHFGNGLRGTSQGIEMTGDWRPITWLQTTLNYSGLKIRMERRPGSTDAGQERRLEEGSPRHQVHAGASVKLPGQTTIDWFFRHVSALPALNVPAYSTSNITVQVALNRELSLIATGRNLHEATHVEFTDGANGLIGIRRSGYIGLRWTR
jgi:iron complex outermembrane receptor protein